MKRTIKRLHVDKHHIAQNIKRMRDGLKLLPTLTLQNRGKSAKAFQSLSILDDEGNEIASLKWSDNPLSCGARVYVETKNPVCVDGGEVVY